MTITETSRGSIGRTEPAAGEQAAGIEGAAAVGLAQQGYTVREIAEFFGASAAQVEEVLAEEIPGGSAAVRAALRGRLRAWAGTSGAGWRAAEGAFGIPHANITRLVRSPERDAGLGAGEQPGYLDAALSGTAIGDERARICARGYAMGATLEQLGARFGVTRERIRQIITTSTPWSTTDIGRTLRGLREAREAEQRAAVRAWSLGCPAGTLEDAAGALGMTEQQVREQLGDRRAHHVAPAVRTGSTRRSDEQIIEDLRAFHRETGRSTAAAFGAWAREQGVPGNQTAAIRFGTWNEALRAAGLTAERGRPRSAISDDDLWAAVIAAVAAPDGGTTNRAVDLWMQAHAGAPSIALVRQRLPYRWSEIAQTALAVLRGEDVALGEEFDAAWRERVTAPRDWSVAEAEVAPTQHIRAAIEDLGVNLSVVAYRDWASARRRPTAQTLQRRSGLSWSELVRAAGGIPGGTTPEWTAQHCREAVAEFRGAVPGGGSEAYAEWARENGRPSVATVISRLGSWRGAVAGCGGGEAR